MMTEFSFVGELITF